MRGTWRTIAAVAVGAAVAAPMGAWAAHSFSDVAGSHPHHTGIAYVAGAGITSGCDNAGNYCPADALTRGQMGTFLHRASGNANGVAPSVNAATLLGQTPAQITGRLAYQELTTGPAAPYVHNTSTQTEQLSCPPDHIVFNRSAAPNVISTDPDWVYGSEPGDVTVLTTNGRPTGFSATWRSYDFSGGPPGQEATSPEQWDLTLTLECIGVEPNP